MEKFGALSIKNEDISEILEEIHRSDKFDTEFGIEDCDVNKDDTINSNKSEDINRG